MTQEEAISVIKTEIGQFIIDEKWKNALALAISALKKQIPQKAQKDLQPTCNNLATDCISRQAAIDAAEKESQVDGAYGYMDTKSIVDLLNDLPSAQPEPCEDAVSRQAVINIINKPVIIKAKEQIEALPSVQPEIIHCKDCINWDTTWTNDCTPNYHYCPLIDGVRKDNFYCADAERRTDGRD